MKFWVISLLAAFYWLFNWINKTSLSTQRSEPAGLNSNTSGLYMGVDCLLSCQKLSTILIQVFCDLSRSYRVIAAHCLTVGYPTSFFHILSNLSFIRNYPFVTEVALSVLTYNINWQMKNAVCTKWGPVIISECNWQQCHYTENTIKFTSII